MQGRNTSKPGTLNGNALGKIQHVDLMLSAWVLIAFRSWAEHPNGVVPVQHVGTLCRGHSLHPHACVLRHPCLLRKSPLGFMLLSVAADQHRLEASKKYLTPCGLQLKGEPHIRKHYFPQMTPTVSQRVNRSVYHLGDRRKAMGVEFLSR